MTIELENTTLVSMEDIAKPQVRETNVDIPKAVDQ